MMEQKKVILIDYGEVLHRSVYSRNALLKKKKELENDGNSFQASKLFIMPSVYTAMTSIISTLKKVGVNADLDDKIIIACDGRNNWRKNFIKEYKDNRGEMRKQAKFVNWDKEYQSHNNLLDKLEVGSPFHIVQIPTLESDDIIAYSTKFFKDNQCVIIGSDHDYDQLLTRDNVRIFSPHPKAKNCPYRILDLDRELEKKKAYKSLMKKVQKETTDNLITEIANEQEYDIRLMLVSLIDLPEFITKKIHPILEEIAITEKEDFDISVFANSIQGRFMDIFSDKNIIAYDKCREKLTRKLKRLKNKKDKGVKKDNDNRRVESKSVRDSSRGIK